MSQEKQVNLGEISYSRMIEIINEKAEEHANLKLQEKDIYISRLEVENKRSSEIYKGVINDLQNGIEEQAKEIERLKGENDNNEEHF